MQFQEDVYHFLWILDKALVGKHSHSEEWTNSNDRDATADLSTLWNIVEDAFLLFAVELIWDLRGVDV
jgi:hypothetical protein